MNLSERLVLNRISGVLLAVALMVWMAPASLAAPISGSILITGGLFTDSGDLENATSLTFDSATVLHTTGDFATNAISKGSAVSFLTNALPLSPSLPTDHWSVGSFTFKLQSLTVEMQSASMLSIAGAGKIRSSVVGLDPVDGFWRLTTQSFNMGSGNEEQSSVIFSFSSSAIAVPEPSSITLVALGLTGLTAMGGRGRRR